MITTTFKAMGTSWWIEINAPARSTYSRHEATRRRDLVAAEALVRDLEATLSRFSPHSSLSHLNAKRAVTCPTLAALTRVALALQSATGGAFDPTLGAELAGLGYDQTFEEIRRRPRPLTPSSKAARQPTHVRVDGDRVYLDGLGSLDLGGIAKGYAVDRVLALLLERGATAVLVDGGGDLRGAGPAFAIGVGAGLIIDTRHGAVATSSTLKRRWAGSRLTPDRLASLPFNSKYIRADRPLHHIIDPATGLPAASSIVTATVVAPDAATADSLATAMIVNPELVLTRLSLLSAHALVRYRDGRWATSPGAPFIAPQQSIPAAPALPARPSRPLPAINHSDQINHNKPSRPDSPKPSRSRSWRPQ